MVVAIVVLLCLAPFILMVLAMCRAASDADDQSEDLYNTLRDTAPMNPDPPRRSGLRIARGR